MESRTFFQMDQTASSHQGILRHQSKCSILSDMDRDMHLSIGCHCEEETEPAITLYTFAQTLGLTLFEKAPVKELFENDITIKNMSDKNQLSLRDS